MNLVDQLRVDGTSKGLCQLYQHKLQGDLTMEQLVKMFVGGIDFCISKDFPTLEFMRERFKGLSEPYGAFVDDEIQTPLVNKPAVVLNGECKAFLEYDQYSVSRVFIRHTSKAAINASDHAFLDVDLFDEAYLAIATAGKDTKVTVNLYGNATVDVTGYGIKINDHRQTINQVKK